MLSSSRRNGRSRRSELYFSATDRVNVILTDEREAGRVAAPVEAVSEGMSMDTSNEESAMNLHIEPTLDIEAAANSLTTSDDIVKAETGLADGDPAKVTDNVNEIDSQEILTWMREERRREAADSIVSGSGELRPWNTDVTDGAQKAANISGTAFDQPEDTESGIAFPSGPTTVVDMKGPTRVNKGEPGPTDVQHNSGVEDTAGSGRRRRPRGRDTAGVAPAAVSDKIESTSDKRLKVGVGPSEKQLAVGVAAVSSSGSDRPTTSTAE